MTLRKKITSHLGRCGGKNWGALTCESYGKHCRQDEQSNFMHFERLDSTDVEQELASPYTLTHL